MGHNFEKTVLFFIRKIKSLIYNTLQYGFTFFIIFLPVEYAKYCTSVLVLRNDNSFVQCNHNYLFIITPATAVFNRLLEFDLLTIVVKQRNLLED